MGKQRQQYLNFVAGIDRDIKEIFLTLSNEQLERVFDLYTSEHGASKCAYAKRTYPKWKSGAVRMSGQVVERLLNLVPTVLDADTRFELVKKLRQENWTTEDVEVKCHYTNWFKIVPPEVERLVKRSHEFELPESVVARVKWVSDGDVLAAQKLLALAETEEARERVKYLAAEYAAIANLVESVAGSTVVTHVITVPQGTITVSISTEGRRTKATCRSGRYFVRCKNSACGAELDTFRPVIDADIAICAPGPITCPACLQVNEYFERDLYAQQLHYRVEISQTLSGRTVVSYDCPYCGRSLYNPIHEIGTRDRCPRCNVEFVVPGRKD